MNELLPFVIVGLTTGSIYGLAGSGLVLTYRTSGIFNFGYGALATVAAYLFYVLHVEYEINPIVSVIVSVLVLGVVLGLVFEPLGRRLTRVSPAYQIVATVGIMLLVVGLATAWFGADVRVYPPWIPTSGITLSTVTVGYDQLTIMGVALIATIVMFAVFRFTRGGVAARGLVDNAELFGLTGYSPVAVRRTSWIVGCTFATLSGVLLAPTLNLDAQALTLLVVEAFGAAAIGLFKNIPLTYAGGLVIGVGQALIGNYTSTSTTAAGQLVAGIGPSLPFIVLFVVLLVTPQRRLFQRIWAARQTVNVWRAPRRVRIAGAIVVLGFLAAVPELFGDRLTVFTTALVYVIMFLSLGLLVRNSGQVSLGHLAFAATASAAFSWLAVTVHLPWLLAVLIGALAAVPVGAFIALPAIRLSGVYLGLATFGFGILVANMFYTSPLMFGSTSAGVPAPRPGVLGADSDSNFYYIVLAFAVVVSVMVTAIRYSRLGRLLRAIADSPVALATQGASVRQLRVVVFCLSAFLAGLGGILLSAQLTTISSATFPTFSSLTLVVLLALMVGDAPWYALLAAFGLVVLPDYLPGGPTAAAYLQALFGVGALVAALQSNDAKGTPKILRTVVDRLGSARTVKPARPPVSVPAHPVVRGEGLAVRDLLVRYSGVVAVDEFSLTAGTGRITGLIGPNGAGKTTTFNACSGLVRPSSGAVFLHGADISRLGPPARARRGLGRTFQRLQLFDTMTVRENVALGRESSMGGRGVFRQVVPKPGDRAEIDAATEQAMELVGITRLGSMQAGLLSTGERRLVELARCLAGPFDMLLLDEPSSGLDRVETREFGEVLQRVVATRGVGILLVEHDMSLVMDVCERIYVLDFGRMIFEGTPAEVAASTTVREAYLGAEVTVTPEEEVRV